MFGQFINGTVIDAYERCFTACENWFAGNAVLIVQGCVIIAFALILYLLFWLLLRKLLPKLLAKRFPLAADEIRALSVPLSFLVLLTGVVLGIYRMNFPSGVCLVVNKLCFIACVCILLRIMLTLVNCTASMLLLKLQKNPDTFSMNKLLLDLSKSLVNLFFWCCAVFALLQNVFMVNVEHLIVSAGVIGLGIAFAAQNTIANIFGAFSILGSKLFKVGDWIKTSSVEGVVEQIGFRSVRIRAFSGLLIDIPNRLISDSQLENISNRHFWREHFCYGLVYQTTPEQIQLALRILDEIGRDLADIMIPEKKVKFTFLTCNNSSLDLDGYVWFRADKWFEMREARGKFNEEVFKRFTDAGLSFAYPTTTVFLEKEDASAPEKK